MGLAWGGVGALTELIQLPFTGRWNFVMNIGNNAVQFENHPMMSGAITLGNTIHYSEGFGPQVELGNGLVGSHERQHTYQGQLLGILYLPSNGIGLALGAMTGAHHGRINWNEVGPQSNPPKPW